MQENPKLYGVLAKNDVVMRNLNQYKKTWMIEADFIGLHSIAHEKETAASNRR